MELRPILFALLGLLSTGGAVALAQDTNVPDQYVYKTVNNRKLTIEVDRPPGWKATDKRPGVVFFFGGAWSHGTQNQFKPQAQYFAQRGLVCLRPDYRVRSRDHTNPDTCVKDAISAMRWVRSHAAELGIDPNKIVAAGGSAGGHLAACTYFVNDVFDTNDDLSISPKPDAMLLYNPVPDLVALQKQRGTATFEKMDAATVEKVSPSWHLVKGAPPMFIIDGTADKFGAQSREFIAKNQALGNPIDAAFTEGQPHAFFNKSPWLEKTTEQADGFLCRIGYLGPEPKVPLPKPDASLASYMNN